MRKMTLFVAVALIGGVLGGTVTERLVTAQVVSKTASGMLMGFDAVEVFADDQCTTSTVYVDMPGVQKTFTLDSNRSVIAMFQGKWFQNVIAPVTVRIQLVIDGVVQLGSGDNSNPLGVHTFNGLTGSTDTNGWNFVSDALAEGVHTAKIRWQSRNGNEVCVDDRSMIIVHK